MTHDVKTTTFESSPKIVHKEKPPNRNAQLLFLFPRNTAKKTIPRENCGVGNTVSNQGYSLEEFRVQVEILYRLFLTVDMS